MPQKFIRIVVLFGILFGMLLPVGAEGANYRTINSGKEGEKLEISDHLVAGKINIIDFYSEFCPPCKAVAPMLEELVTKDPDIVVGTVDINRPGERGIDWRSPVSQQYKLRSIPHFKIYDAEGKLLVQGQEAKQYLVELFEKNKIE